MSCPAELRIVVAGREAARVLAAGRTARVIARFSRSVYVANARGQGVPSREAQCDQRAADEVVACGRESRALPDERGDGVGCASGGATCEPAALRGRARVGEAGGDSEDLSNEKTDEQISKKFVTLSEDLLGPVQVKRALELLWKTGDMKDVSVIPPALVVG